MYCGTLERRIEPITEAEKEEIKRAVNEYMKDKKLKVIFD